MRFDQKMKTTGIRIATEPPDVGEALRRSRDGTRSGGIVTGTLPAAAGARGSEFLLTDEVSKIIFFFAKFYDFLAGSFSTVSKRNCARKYAFESIFKLYKMCTLLHRSKLNILE